MANNISLHEIYLDTLDQVYKLESKTSFLDTQEIASKVETGKKFKVDKMTLSGLADYSRSTGYTTGDVVIAQEELEPNYDRGIKFNVDTMDNIETGYNAFGKLGATFEREKSIPEVDAFRIAAYAQNAGKKEVATLTKDTIVAAIDAGLEHLRDKEVSENDRVLFISASNYSFLKTAVPQRFVRNVNGEIDRNIEMYDGMRVIPMPSARFYSGITLASKSYANANASINFMIVAKSAIVQFAKHIVSNIISPDNNPDMDAFIMKYRNYGLCDVWENKADGVYVHVKADAAVVLTLTSSQESSTIVVKQNTTAGDVIAAETDGTYILPADSTAYYYSVEKASYTTQTGTVALTADELVSGSTAKTITLVLAD